MSTYSTFVIEISNVENQSNHGDFASSNILIEIKIDIKIEQ